MQIKTPPSVPSVVKREDKVETLRRFISGYLQSSAALPAEITLIARSAESPVARALVLLGSDIAARGLCVRAVFTQVEPEKTAAGWSVSGPDISFHRQLRWAKNPRLVDAHEQLVLDAETCWVGDCMRRDPSRRDAYEQFAAADRLTSATIATSFDRLWSASEPLLIRVPTAVSAAPQASLAALADLSALTPCDDNSGPLASSPH